MEDDQALKHMCKFCYKSFPCGRSLGGHMRSHLINIPLDHNQKKTDKKLHKKKLPPLINHKNNPKIDYFVQEGGDFGYEKTNRRSKSCKECGKSFQSWKALFGHMKCHSVNGKAADSVGEDSWNSSNESYDESGTPLCRKKRSQRMKRYTSTTNSCSFNTIPNFSPCVSEIDQQEEEEVALSLILLSRDSIGNSRGADSIIDSSDNSSESLQAKILSKSLDKNSRIRLEKIEQSKSLRTVEIPRNREVGVEVDEYHSHKELVKKKKLDIEGNDHEVNSPKKPIKKRGLDQFETEFKKENSSKMKLIDSHDSTTFSVYKTPSEIDFDSRSKFTCTVCKKAFASYQALGGHRASHKKFNGCCAPVTENSHENENPPNQKLIKKFRSSETPNRAFAEKAEVELGLKKNKEHECPICFKVFRSGQALGGHKRSHLIAVQANNPDVVIQKPEIRDFLDLNLPAPDEEEEEQSNELTPWWIGARPDPESLLGLLSS